jgi:hypothetical protein
MKSLKLRKLCRSPRRLFHVVFLPEITVVFALVSFSHGGSVQHEMRHGRREKLPMSPRFPQMLRENGGFR